MVTVVTVDTLVTVVTVVTVDTVVVVVTVETEVTVEEVVAVMTVVTWVTSVVVWTRDPGPGCQSTSQQTKKLSNPCNEAWPLIPCSIISQYTAFTTKPSDRGWEKSCKFPVTFLK